MQVAKWMALPPNAPAEFVRAYRQAFAQIVKATKFKAKALNVIGAGFPIATDEEM